MRINLANYEVLPTLVNGKVIALDCPYGKKLDYTVAGRTISLLTIGKFTVVPDGQFNPEYYDILETPKYTLLVNNKDGLYLKTVSEYLGKKQSSIVDKLMKHMKTSEPVTYKVGDRIHLKDKMGIYQISYIQGNNVTITCKKWQYNPKESDKYRAITLDDIKCLAGGLNNYNH